MSHSDAPTDAPATGLPDLTQVPPEDRDRVWFETYYQGDRVPQLTLRAVLMGGALGMLMSVSNLYTTLKLGWAFGVAITACVLSYAIWNSFVAMGLAKSRMSILENNCMQSAASAAGYSTGGTIATAAGALLLIGGDAHRLGWVPLGIWAFFVALLGVFLAVPMKRQMINQEQLPFPSGIAAAETLRSLYAEGEAAMKKAGDLIDALIAGAVVGAARCFAVIPEAIDFHGNLYTHPSGFTRFSEWIAGKIGIRAAYDYPETKVSLQALGVQFEPSLLLVAAGAITGMRVCASMLLASIVSSFVLAPWVLSVSDWVDPRDRDRSEIVVHLENAGDEAKDPVAHLTGAAGTAIDVVLRDNGVHPDRKANDGTWSAFAPAADSYAVTVSVDGRSFDAGSVSWEADNRKRDLAIEALGQGGTATAGTSARFGKHFTGDLETVVDPETGELAVASLRKWSLWLGTSILVFSGLTAFALNAGTIKRAIGGARAAGSGGDVAERMAAIEVPTSWMVAGLVPVTLGLCAVCWVAMGIAPWLGVLSVVLSGVLSLVACRATGETDTTPIGAMGKITQFVYAVLAPADKTVNLMTAGVTAGAASSSADLLTDLKSGYLLGANPRQQFLAQLAGVFFGIVAIVPAWYLMVPSAEDPLLANSPATTMWYAVAQALANGVGTIPITARYAIVVGALFGVTLPLVEKLFPKARSFLPSSMGVGLAFVITFSNALGFFLGALIADRWVRRDPKAYEDKVIPLASGAIAGESLVSAGFAMLNSLRLLAV